jgi:ATP-binding cassette, subfamily C (CFTR/MRP), member 1
LQTDGSTPSSTTLVSAAVDIRELTENLENVNGKLQRKQSFTKAVLSSKPLTQTESSGVVTKEHTEQGRVKKDVYYQYVQAASKLGFAMFVFATALSQVISVMSNNVLRNWGEHNRESGGNLGVGKYLLQYGVLSLSSVLLSGAAAIIIWVFCSIRSARRLHDNVSIYY